MQAKLHLIKGNPQGKQVEVPEGTLTVGRAEDRDLIIASTRVSRQHCDITNDENGVAIRDNGSGNGTLVNGTRIKEQKLEPGDQLTIGPLTFVVEIDGVKEKAEPQAAPAPKPAAPTAPKPQPKQAAKPKPKADKPRVPATEDDILASLEQMSGRKGRRSSPKTAQPATEAAPSDEEDDVLEISDDDLLDA